MMNDVRSNGMIKLWLDFLKENEQKLIYAACFYLPCSVLLLFLG